MPNRILNCCKHHPNFLISYVTGTKYFVCEICVRLDFWSRGIIKKEKL